MLIKYLVKKKKKAKTSAQAFYLVTCVLMLFLGFCEGRKGVTDARVCLRPLNVISHTRFQAWPVECH